MLHDRWRQHALLAVGAYAVLAVALSAGLLTLRVHTAELSGLERRVYPGVGFAGEPLLDDFSPTVTLGFLDDDPALPRQFFSARWQGFWYVPEAGDYDIHGSGDDRLDVWIDGVLVIRRFPPAEMHTVVRTISLDAGLHNIGIGYEQHGGAHSLRLGWSLPGRRVNPLPAHRLFPNRPSVLDLRLASAAAWFDTIILIVWIVPAVIGGACLGWRAWVASAAPPESMAARVLLLAVFTLLSTPPLLYRLVPALRDLRTGPWWCAIVILLLAAFLWTRLVRYDAAPAHAARPAGRLPLLLLAVLALLQIGYWYTVHLADLRFPLDSRYADMLPLMRSGFADLDLWRSPYRPHDVPWTLTNYYLPLTFLPYYVAYRCGLDIRYVNLACFVLIDLTLLLLWPRGQSRARQLYFLGCWVAASSALHAAIDAHQLTRIIHLAPYWLYVTVTYAMLVLGRPFVSACAALCALAARETAVFHIVPMGVALLSLRPAMARTYLTVIPAGLLAVFLPFFIDNPGFYSGNLAQYSSLGWVIERDGGYHFVGLTGLLHQVGLMDYHWHFAAAGLLVLLASQWLRMRSWDTGSVLFLCFCCANVSALFALVPWPYLTIPNLLILAVFVLGEFSDRCSRGRSAGFRLAARETRP